MVRLCPHVSRYHADGHSSVGRGEVMPHPLSCCDVRDEVRRPDARCELGAPPPSQGAAGWGCEVDG